MPYCRHCGDEVESGWKACPHCGQADPTNAGNVATGTTRGKDQGGWTRLQKLLAVLGGLILFLVVIAALAGSEGDDENPRGGRDFAPDCRH